MTPSAALQLARRSLSVLLLAVACRAQSAESPKPPTSPEVHSDRRVTFRLRAPKAGIVSLRGDWMPGETPAMAKNDEGVWSLTVGPLDPDVYSYSFLLDGVEVIDPANPAVRLQHQSSTSSILEVPGAGSVAHARRAVPHGTVETHWYESAFGDTRGLYVYLPPGYHVGQSPRSAAHPPVRPATTGESPAPQPRYPVLYLLHGGAGNEGLWTSFGRAHVILDNLIADGRAKPMLVVMPLGQVPGEGPRRYMGLESDLTDRILPLIQATYRVGDAPSERAIAGLSMGGLQALHIGLGRLDLFSAIGDFSAGARSPREPDDFETRYAALLSDPAALNRRLSLLWLGCGDQDRAAYPATLQLAAALKKHDIRHILHVTGGGHSWLNWRRYLAEFAPLLFRAGPSAADTTQGERK